MGLVELDGSSLGRTSDALVEPESVAWFSFTASAPGLAMIEAAPGDGLDVDLELYGGSFIGDRYLRYPVLEWDRVGPGQAEGSASVVYGGQLIRVENVGDQADPAALRVTTSLASLPREMEPNDDIDTADGSLGVLTPEYRHVLGASSRQNLDYFAFAVDAPGIVRFSSDPIGDNPARGLGLRVVDGGGVVVSEVRPERFTRFVTLLTRLDAGDYYLVAVPSPSDGLGGYVVSGRAE
jgi:hypothetical protein